MEEFYSDRLVLPLPDKHRFPMTKLRAGGFCDGVAQTVRLQ